MAKNSARPQRELFGVGEPPLLLSRVMSGQGRGTPRVNPIATSAVVVGSVTANQGTAGASAWPVTSAQGTAGSLGNGWPVKITDGTNVLGTALQPLKVQITSGTTTVTQGTSPWVVGFVAPAGASAVTLPNWVITRTAHLASGALPAAGAFTSQAAQAIPAGTKKISFWITYTRGAAGGYPVFELLCSNGTEEIRVVLGNVSSLAVSQPNGAFDTLQLQLIGPKPQNGSALVFGYTFNDEDLPAGATTTRLLAAELGVTGTPGTCAITFTAEG